ncbi:MAG TPA: beta-aspartyl-peptidase [Clostridiaceae bacterium]|nr:beta-aspartyl-peptidase [Clostridiaceae bacterium]
MFKLLKGGYCYSPDDIGIKDILVVGGKIYIIEKNIPYDFVKDLEIIDCNRKIVCPGFIDQHAHIIGGGGEEGAKSYIPELTLGDIISAGVTTVVGLLGFDAVARSMTALLSKARSLQYEGLNTYIYTGNYSVPPVTLTGSILSDIVFVDKIIGVGEIAIADYRSSYPGVDDLKKIAAEALKGGMLSGKAGVVHIHVGEGKEGLSVLFNLIDKTDFPVNMFVPTHINRNKALFKQGMEFAKKGGNIDLTAGESSDSGLSVPDAIHLLLQNGINIEKITVSSDGNGSRPAQGENRENAAGKVLQLFNDIRECVLSKNIGFETAIKTVTSNVAKVLKIYPQKGAILSGSDADILVLDKGGLNVDKVLINGFVMVDGGKVLKGG